MSGTESRMDVSAAGPHDDRAAGYSRHEWLPRGGAGLRYRLGVASRAVAAILGGYAVSALAAAALAVALPGPRVESTLTGMLASFVVYAIAVMWVFAARTAWRAWLGLIAAAALPGMLLLVHFLTRTP